MPSQVWGRDPQEAFEEPYEYQSQEQFAREAETLMGRLYHVLNSDHFRFSGDDESPEKAEWLLAMDALDSIRDCLKMLDRKEHRIAGRLFRDIVETMDLAAYFHGRTRKSMRDLKTWYAGEVVPHREYRNHVQQTVGADARNRIAKQYSILSRFTHRSYRAILDGYVRGGESTLVHDGSGQLFGNHDCSKTFLVLPQTVASYYALLASLILGYSSKLTDLGFIEQKELQGILSESLELQTVPRRFFPRRWLADKLDGSEEDHPASEQRHLVRSTHTPAGDTDFSAEFRDVGGYTET